MQLMLSGWHIPHRYRLNKQTQNIGLKSVFILREDMKEDFIRLVGRRIEKQIDTEYVIQDTSLLPLGRMKPFGTAFQNLKCHIFLLSGARDAHRK